MGQEVPEIGNASKAHLFLLSSLYLLSLRTLLSLYPDPGNIDLVTELRTVPVQEVVVLPRLSWVPSVCPQLCTWTHARSLTSPLVSVICLPSSHIPLSERSGVCAIGGQGRGCVEEEGRLGLQLPPHTHSGLAVRKSRVLASDLQFAFLMYPTGSLTYLDPL